MDISSVPMPVVFAFAGALSLKLLELTELQHVRKANRPDLRDVAYWVPFLILPILGGGLAYAYVSSGMDLKPMLAINVGVSAPLILRAMAQINPISAKPIDPGEDA